MILVNQPDTVVIGKQLRKVAVEKKHQNQEKQQKCQGLTDELAKMREGKRRPPPPLWFKFSSFFLAPSGIDPL